MSVRTDFMGRNGIFSRVANITPSDTGYLPPDTIGLYVTVGGTVTVEGLDGEAAQFTVGNAAWIPGAPARVMATGTSATGIIALRG